ncbi:glycosyltransferase family 4 protein [Oleidesulfovibrio sp.]|uniref:glycosyltransferase family 4 protein n=1 Tax=Oleidesulfovibrio sp. TaxID=2909707 RepID=UPI003A83F20D
MLIIVYHADSVDRAYLGEALGNILGDDVEQAVVAFPDTVRGWIKDGTWIRRFRQVETVILYTHDITVAPDPLQAFTAALWLGKRVVQVDLRGRFCQLSLWSGIKMGLALAKDFLRLPAWRRELDAHLSGLEASKSLIDKQPPELTAPVAYLRPDIILNLKAGGSVGHIAGVLNNLGSFAATPVFYTVDPVPTINDTIQAVCILPDNKDRWTLRGMAAFHFSRYFSQKVWASLGGKQPAFIYQRHGLDNWSGAELAITHRVPFVLEYNGSEVWVARNWGRAVPNEKLSLRVETLSLEAADLIVVVSQPLKDELVERGISERKLLVNPNGVDPDVYHPDVDGSSVRSAYGLEEKCVIGFIGTFGKWHGAEKLAEAFDIMVSNRPELRNSVSLMYIGDGLTKAQTETFLVEKGLAGLSVFTGTVPQHEGPKYLAACDILVAPHVPNEDGTKFFGSPTKLFEYMAMGRAIAASALDQMDDILEHNVTALKAIPGDAVSLARNLELLVENESLRYQLGTQARQKVVEAFTWKQHTERIVNALMEQWHDK